MKNGLVQDEINATESTLRGKCMVFFLSTRRLMEERCRPLKRQLKALREKTLTSLKQITAGNERDARFYVSLSLVKRVRSHWNSSKGWKMFLLRCVQSSGKHVNGSSWCLWLLLWKKQLSSWKKESRGSTG